MAGTLSSPLSLLDLAANLRRGKDFATVLATLAKGNSATVDGAWGSSAALAAAAVVVEETPRTHLIVIAHPREVESWAADLKSFSALDPV
ncbi:MAG: hypothetical protein ACKO23_03240, partial [Gemmataceae bacterium]